MMKWKRNNYKFWHSPFALVILFCILIVSGYKIIDLEKKNIITSKEKESALNKIDDLNKRIDSLSSNIAKLGTEEGKEEIIRDKYPVVKEGEKMVTIVNEENKVNSLTTQKAGHGFWNWIKGIFNK